MDIQRYETTRLEYRPHVICGSYVVCAIQDGLAVKVQLDHALSDHLMLD